MGALARHNVQVHGDPAARPMVFAHGFGCDQNMWRYVWPAFAEDHRVVLFDHVGPGGRTSPPSTPSTTRRSTATRDDVLEICRRAGARRDVVFVGHSVSAMIGALAADRASRSGSARW